METVTTFAVSLPPESGADSLAALENRIATTLPAGVQVLRWAIVKISDGVAHVEGVFVGSATAPG